MVDEGTDGTGPALTGSGRPHGWLARQPGAHSHQLTADPPPDDPTVVWLAHQEVRAAQPLLMLRDEAEHDTGVQVALHGNHLLSSLLFVVFVLVVVIVVETLAGERHEHVLQRRLLAVVPGDQ